MKYFKFFGFVLTVIGFFLMTIPLYPVFLCFPSFTLHLLFQIVSFYSSLLLFILNINVNFENLGFVKTHENHLIVSNHLSYTDVLILAAKLPSCFVTSKEVKASPFLGQLSSLAGCLFVDRKDKGNLKGEINELREALNDGLNVTVFPEATSTNGDSVLRFRRPLFESSLATGKPILPITINYQLVSGRKVSAFNRDLVCWYGDMDFLPHFLRLLDQNEIRVDVVIHEPFLPEFMPSIELASKSHEVVAHAFQSLNNVSQEVL